MQVWKVMWRDFGGGREAADADSAATAAREFAEETLVRPGGLQGSGLLCAALPCDQNNVASVSVHRASPEPDARPPCSHPCRQGLFGACGVDAASVALAAAAMAAQLRDPRQALRVVHSLKKGAYHFFIAQVCRPLDSVGWSGGAAVGCHRAAAALRRLCAPHCVLAPCRLLTPPPA